MAGTCASSLSPDEKTTLRLIWRWRNDGIDVQDDRGSICHEPMFQSTSDFILQATLNALKVSVESIESLVQKGHLEYAPPNCGAGFFPGKWLVSDGIAITIYANKERNGKAEYDVIEAYHSGRLVNRVKTQKQVIGREVVLTDQGVAACVELETGRPANENDRLPVPENAQEAVTRLKSPWATCAQIASIYNCTKSSIRSRMKRDRDRPCNEQIMTVEDSHDLPDPGGRNARTEYRVAAVHRLLTACERSQEETG